MLNKIGFDLWADDYDKSVNLSEEANEYPFAGYKNLLNQIYKTIHIGEKSAILDIGFGTGVLTRKLYDDGYSIYGIDFSNKMIEIARTKMPEATLIQHDFSTGLPKKFSNIKFDFIISTYAIHHLTNDNKIIVINKLLEHLNPNGKMLIGDVAFETQIELENCKIANGESWDSDEIYIVFDDLKKHFPNAVFSKISKCAGVVIFTK